MEIIKRYMHKLINIASKEEMKVLPGHLSFFMVLSLVPAITLIGILCNKLGLVNTDVVDFFKDVIPTGAMEVIKPFINSSGGGGAFIYLVIGFILVSNGSNAIIQTSNTLYKINNSSFLKDRIKSIFLTILLMFLFVFILIVIGFGNRIMGYIMNLETLDNMSKNGYHLFVYLKWPFAFFIIYIILKFMYTIAPDKEIKSSSVTKGSIFTTLGWLFITGIYSYYANNIARYDLFYGNLSNIAILMMWIYFIAYIFTIGMAINVNNYNYMEESSNNKKEENE